MSAAPVATYGTLLLDIATHQTAVATQFRPRLRPALAELGHSTLERRIRHMTAARPARPHIRSALLALGSLACAVGACELPRPAGFRATTGVPLASLTSGVMSRSDATAPIGADDIRRMLGPARLATMHVGAGRVQLVSVIDSANGTRRVIVRGLAGDSASEQLALPNAAITLRRFAPGVVTADTTVVATVRVGAPGTDAATSGPLISAPQIRTRGKGSLPPVADSLLVVVDRRIVGRGRGAVERIDAATIQSVDVLKGTFATDRYGDASRAGVIVMTTNQVSTAR